MSNAIKPTLEEIISTLEHSNLATVIVEGNEDIIIYRNLEKRLVNIDVLPVYGRKIVLDVFEEKQNNPKLKNKKIAFIADKDVWCNIGIPNEFNDSSLIFTQGYSLENDVFIDYDCQGIINNNENKSQFNVNKLNFIQWYALALQATLNNMDERQSSTSAPAVHSDRKLSKHPDEVLNNFQNLSQLRPEESFPQVLKDQLIDGFPLTIRGKSLMALFVKSCSNHKTLGIFESVAERPGQYIEEIFEQVAAYFENSN